jgi:hypothetical protein
LVYNLNPSGDLEWVELHSGVVIVASDHPDDEINAPIDRSPERCTALDGNKVNNDCLRPPDINQHKAILQEL